tara:strand:- start:881 stop:1279 length:399 start_codon:yes stop_codon:yes gene_type:complete
MNLSHKNLSLIIKGLLDNMIPDINNKLLPCGSDVIDIDIFIKFIHENKSITKVLYSILPENYDDIKNKNDYIFLGSNLAKSKELEMLIEDFVLKSYFSSDIVLELLSSRDTLDEVEYNDNLCKNKILEILKN